MSLKIPELRFKIEGPILIMYTSLCKNDKRFILPESTDHYHFRQPCCVLCVFHWKGKDIANCLLIETFFNFFLNMFKTDWIELRPYGWTGCLHIYLSNCKIENLLLLESPPPPPTAFLRWYPETLPLIRPQDKNWEYS